MQVRSRNLNLTLLRALSSHLTSPTDASSFCVPHYRVSDGTAVATCSFLGCNLWPNRSKIRSTNPIKNTAAPPHEYTHHHHFLRFLLLLLPPSAHGALRPLPVFPSIWSSFSCRQYSVGKCASKELAKEQASDLLLFSRRSSINY